MTAKFSRYRFVLQASFDGAAWFVGVFLTTFLRYEMDISKVDPGGVALVAGCAAVAQILLGTWTGLYVHRWRYGTLEEVTATLRVVAVVTALITLADLLPLLDRAVPVSAAILSGFISVAVMCLGRLAWRAVLDIWSRANDEGREPVIVVGAGEGGLQIITAMHKAGPYRPVAILDDDRQLRNLEVKGVRVCGGMADIGPTAERTGAKTLIIAIPSASAATLREISSRADRLGLEVLMLPPVAELLGQGVGVADIRPLTEADLLGRRELSLDIDSVAGYLSGRRVLVTGAGGSIGSELCRQIHSFAPETLVMLDRDESALQNVQISIEGRGLLESRNLVICCIRDRARLREVLDEHCPEVIFHAAALKHLPMLEMYPEEGWKTNVWGTCNLLELASEFGVERFVNVSTDKAADATSVLGRTKRLAEQLTSFTGDNEDGTYLSVRFGNVLGSRGSVLPLFREQIARGGPVTVTDPEVTRFFMTIPEACELVIQAGALDAYDGKVLVLDMGEPVRIADLARRLIAESHRDIEIEYTGLRSGEKRHEVLFSPEETPRRSEHQLISWVDVPGLDAESAARLDPYSVEILVDLTQPQPTRDSEPA